MSENRAAELERDISRTRDDVDRILDALGDKLSPKRLVGDAIEGATKAPRRVAKTVGAQAAHHPLPTALIGLGIVWLVAATRRDARESRRESPNGSASWEDSLSYAEREDLNRYQRMHLAQDQPPRFLGESDEDYDNRLYVTRGVILGVDATPQEDRAAFRSRVDAEHKSLRERVRSVLARIGDAAGDAKRGAMGAAGVVKHGVMDAAGAVKHGVMDAAGGVKHGAERVGSFGSEQAGHVKHAAQKVGRSARDMHEAHPLVSGAIMVAVGAAIGALTPNTKAENRLMADKRERLAENFTRRARAVRDEAADFAVETVERAADRVRSDLGSDPTH